MRNMRIPIISLMFLVWLMGLSIGCSRRSNDDANASDKQKAEQTAREEPSAGDSQAATQPTPAPPPAPVEKPKPIVVPAGTVLTVRTSQALSSKKSQTGQTFLGELAQPLSVAGRSALAAGSTVSGTVVAAKAKGEGQLDLALNSISVGGHTYQIQTNRRSPLSRARALTEFAQPAQ